MIPSPPRASCGLEPHFQRSWLAKGSVHLSSVFTTSFKQNMSVKSAVSLHWRFLPWSGAAPSVRGQLPQAGSARSWQFRTAPLRPPWPFHLGEVLQHGTFVEVRSALQPEDLHCTCRRSKVIPWPAGCRTYCTAGAT